MSNLVIGGFIPNQYEPNTNIAEEIQNRLTPFSRSFSPLLYFLIKNLKVFQTEHPDRTYTTREICERLDVPYPNRYMSMYLRFLHQSDYIELTLENNEYNRYRFKPVEKIHTLGLKDGGTE